MGALSAVQKAILSSVVTDKGHCHSSGRSVVEFWISQRRVAHHAIIGTEVAENTGCTTVVKTVIDDLSHHTRVDLDESLSHSDTMVRKSVDLNTNDVDSMPCRSEVDDAIVGATAELCSWIFSRLEPAFNALQQRRDQLEAVRSDWHKVPIEAHVYAPVIALRATLMKMIEEQDRLEADFLDQVKDMVESHHGGEAVLAAVRLRCRAPALAPDG